MKSRFERRIRLRARYTQALFDPGQARQDHGVARGIARNLHRGHCGHPTTCDLVASELAHDGR